MKTKYISLFAALVAVSLASCGGSKDEPINKPNPDPTPNTPTNGVEVSITTASIQTKKAQQLEFVSNDQMNIFPKTFNRIDAPNIVDGVIATYDGSKWTMSPKVLVNESQKIAYMYAVAPYDASYTDAQRIPVDLNKQVDLMYSGSYQPASMTTPTVKLTMKHALSLLSFNIVPINYSGAGNLTSLAINGDIVYTTGVMDASTGKISNLAGQGAPVKAQFNKKVQAGGWRSEIPGLWSLPFVHKSGEVKLTAVIDGKTFETYIPEVEVKTGWQYIFRLALTNSGLEFDPSKTETISLNVTSDGEQTFNGYGKIVLTANGSWLNSPLLRGDAVFGTLSTPSSSSSYTTSVKVEGLSNGQNVTLESWNTSGFKLETLEGVGTIDISDYE